MRSTLKSVMTAVGLVLIAIGAGAVVLAPNVEPLVRGRLERSLGEAFGTEVSIGRMAFSPLKQCVDLSGVTVLNPEGFKQIPAFTSSLVRLEFDPKTVFAKSPVIRNTEIVGADIFYRHEIGEGNNLDVITARADAYMAEERVRGFVVRSINSENAEVHFSTNLIPKSRVGMRLIDIRVEDAGGERSVSAPKAGGIILKSVVREVITLRGLLSGGDGEPEAEPL